MAATDLLDARTAEADAHLPPQGYVHGLTADALQGARLRYDLTIGGPRFIHALEDLERAGATLVPFDSQGRTLEPTGVFPRIPAVIAFFGRAWSDDKLLAYGYAYEQVTHARIPPTVQNATLLQDICG